MGNRHGCFEFVASISNDLMLLIDQLEDALFTQPQTVLMQARLYTEELVKLVSKEEEIETVFPLKHAERIHKLYRQDAIEEDLYIKLEWIRKTGNKAAHDVSSMMVEDGLKAHKYLFDISVWYTQVYVSYDFEAPIYKLPVPEKQDLGLSGLDMDEFIKPYLEQSFKKIEEMKKEIQNELDELKKNKNNVFLETEEAPVEKEVVQFSLLDYLETKQIPYIDNRDKNGALWIVGGWELSKELFSLKEYRIYFRFVKKGSRATKYQPSWFLLNKNLNDPKVKADEEDSPKKDVSIKLEEKPVYEPSTAIHLEKVSSDFWRKKGQLLMPEIWMNKKIDELQLDGLNILNQYTSIQNVADISEEHLRQIYKIAPDDFHAVVQELYWLGFRFIGRLASFQPLPDIETEFQVKVSSRGNENIRKVLGVPLSTRLLDKRISHLKDLNGYLGQSVKWLTKIDVEKIVEQIERGLDQTTPAPLEAEEQLQHEEVPEIQTTTDSRQTAEILDTIPFKIAFSNEMIEVRNSIADCRIDEIGVLGCDNLIRQLMDMELVSVRDLPRQLEGLHLRLKGVGERTIVKFWNQLIEKNSERVIPNLEKLEYDQEGNKLIRLDEKTLVVPHYLLDFPIRIDDFPFGGKAVTNIIMNGMDTAKDLPAQFEEIGKIDGAGKKKVQMIFDRLSSLLELANQRYKMQQLPLDERLKVELSSFNEWINKLLEDEDYLKSEKISPRYLDLMQRRYEAMRTCTRLTLEVLGEQDGVTRERIRQILEKGDIRVTRRINELIKILKQLVEENPSFLPVSFLTNDHFPHYVLRVALEEAGFEVVTVGKSFYLSLLNKDAIENYMTGIKKELEKVFHLHVITPSDLRDFCLDKGTEDGVSPEFIEKTAYLHVKWLNPEQGLLIGMRKFQAVEMVMLQYPDGVEVYKREEELLEKANDLMPGEFTDNRDFNAIATRQDVSDRILLWGRGSYIHSSFVTTDSDWVQRVETLAQSMLDSEEFIHVLKLYEAVRDEAEKRKVPNEYALYTLLRRYSTSLVSLIKFPAIHQSGSVKHENADYVEKFIREKGGSASVFDIHELFVAKRGWKKFTLEMTLSSNERFIPYKYAHYTLLSNFDHIQLDKIPYILNAIQNNLADSPFISIHSIFKEHEIVLKSMGIETKQTLYAILKNRGVPDAILKQYPYILKPGHDVDSISSIRYIEQFILEKEDIVAREEVMEWVESVYGGDEKALDVALMKVPEILYYAKGQYGEYVHRETVGLDEHKEAHLHQVIKERLPEVVSAKNRAYVMVSDIFHETLLPELDHGFLWTSDLLEDVLKKSGKWTVIGSYGEIILPPNSPIQNEVDLVAYVLSHHFNGVAKISDLLRFLTDIRYSSGKLLFIVEEAIRNDEAPFVIDGDEVFLKSLIMEGITSK